MEELVYLISNAGFPIVVSIFLLVRIEQKISQLTVSLEELARAIVRLEEKLER